MVHGLSAAHQLTPSGMQNFNDIAAYIAFVNLSELRQ
jgi:hypothetical protein